MVVLYSNYLFSDQLLQILTKYTFTYVALCVKLIIKLFECNIQMLSVYSCWIHYVIRPIRRDSKKGVLV